MCLCMYVCVYVCMSVCVCMSVGRYVGMYVCTRVPSCNARKRMKLQEGAVYRNHLRGTFE